MKTIFKTIFFFCAGLTMTGICSAQTITINSVFPTTAFCAGNAILVNYTVTGLWGHRNAFTLQLSDVNGNFSTTFTNLASFEDTLPGSFLFIYPTSKYIQPSGSYRVRIVGASPYIESADNGFDINIKSAYTSGSLGLSLSSGVFMVNSQLDISATFTFSTYSNLIVSGGFAFNVGDTTYTVSASGFLPSVGAVLHYTYYTPGIKTVNIIFNDPNVSGCDIDTSITFHVFACPGPLTIPKYAFVDSGQAQLIDTPRTKKDTVIRKLGGYGKTIWINPGITYTTPSVVNDTFFCESGSTLRLSGIDCVVYLKRGASFQLVGGRGENTIFADISTSIDDGKPKYDGAPADTIIKCSNIAFDISNAPHNTAFPLGVKDNSMPPENIMIVPNPTMDYITVKNIPAYTISMSVFNALGAEVMEVLPHGESSMTLDLKKCESGVYFIRIISDRGVVTKKIIKE